MQTQIVGTITAPTAANVGEGLLEMGHFVQACFISIMIVVVVFYFCCFCSVFNVVVTVTVVFFFLATDE